MNLAIIILSKYYNLRNILLNFNARNKLISHLSHSIFYKANSVLIKCASNYVVINNYVGWLSIFMNVRAQKFIISQLMYFLLQQHFDGRNNADVMWYQNVY